MLMIRLMYYSHNTLLSIKYSNGQWDLIAMASLLLLGYLSQELNNPTTTHESGMDVKWGTWDDYY